MARAFVDLHCHSAASLRFACPSPPTSFARPPQRRADAPRDHGPRADRRRAARPRRPRARRPAPIIVGEEVRTADGDMIGLFLEQQRPARPVGRSRRCRRSRAGRPGRAAAPVRPLPRFESQDGGHARGARPRGRLHRGPQRPAVGRRQRAGRGARAGARPAGRRRLDAHSPMEVGVAYTVLDGTLRRRDGLLARPRRARDIVPGRASYFVRLLTPLAKVANACAGIAAIRPAGRPGATARATAVSEPVDGRTTSEGGRRRPDRRIDRWSRHPRSTTSTGRHCPLTLEGAGDRRPPSPRSRSPAAAPPADDHLDRRAARRSSCSSCT